MAIRDILIHPDPRLKSKAEQILVFDDKLRLLANDMLETMYGAPGIGLAGPQVAQGKRIIVMDCVKDQDAPARPIVLINPEIKWRSDELSVYEEGCLSIPEQFADVSRPASVEVTWQDLDGGACSEKFEGLWATCVQHEIDHLDGVLFIDHLSALRRQLITRKMIKFKRDRQRA